MLYQYIVLYEYVPTWTTYCTQLHTHYLALKLSNVFGSSCLRFKFLASCPRGLVSTFIWPHFLLWLSRIGLACGIYYWNKLGFTKYLYFKCCLDLTRVSNDKSKWIMLGTYGLSIAVWSSRYTFRVGEIFKNDHFRVNHIIDKILCVMS